MLIYATDRHVLPLPAGDRFPIDDVDIHSTTVAIALERFGDAPVLDSPLPSGTLAASATLPAS